MNLSYICCHAAYKGLISIVLRKWIIAHFLHSNVRRYFCWIPCYILTIDINSKFFPQNNVGVGNCTKVQFKTPSFDKNNNRSGLISPNKDKKLTTGATYPALGALKRSKSLGAADALKLMEVEASFPNYSPKFTEYHLFPTKMHDSISQAVQSKIFIFSFRFFLLFFIISCNTVLLLFSLFNFFFRC